MSQWLACVHNWSIEQCSEREGSKDSRNCTSWKLRRILVRQCLDQRIRVVSCLLKDASRAIGGIPSRLLQHVDPWFECSRRTQSSCICAICDTTTLYQYIIAAQCIRVMEESARKFKDRGIERVRLRCWLFQTGVSGNNHS